jgi:hypothetical protein
MCHYPLQNDDNEESDIDCGDDAYLQVVDAFKVWMSGSNHLKKVTQEKYLQVIKRYFRFWKSREPMWDTTLLLHPHQSSKVPRLPPIRDLGRSGDFCPRSLQNIIPAYINLTKFLLANLHSKYFGQNELPETLNHAIIADLRAKKEDAQREQASNGQEVIN